MLDWLYKRFNTTMMIAAILIILGLIGAKLVSNTNLPCFEEKCIYQGETETCYNEPLICTANIYRERYNKSKTIPLECKIGVGNSRQPILCYQWGENPYVLRYFEEMIDYSNTSKTTIK